MLGWLRNIDLVSMSETGKEKNRYLLTVQDGFTRFASAYLICKKKAGTVTWVLICEHFSALGLPNQIHSENGREFVIMDRVIKWVEDPTHKNPALKTLVEQSGEVTQNYSEPLMNHGAGGGRDAEWMGLRDEKRLSGLQHYSA